VTLRRRSRSSTTSPYKEVGLHGQFATQQTARHERQPRGFSSGKVLLREEHRYEAQMIQRGGLPMQNGVTACTVAAEKCRRCGRPRFSVEGKLCAGSSPKRRRKSRA